MSVAHENQFVERVSQYPVVNDTYGLMTDYYLWAKNKNYVINSGLNITESIVQSAVSKVQPVLNRFDDQIKNIDRISCNQLDRLEQKFPIICEPTSQIVDKTKELYETAVKQRVRGVVLPVVNPVIHTVSGVRYGVSKVTEKTSAIGYSMCNTRGGQMLLSRLNDALDLADRSIDRYLPDENLDAESEDPESKCKEAMEVDEAQNSNNTDLTLSRVSSLTHKVRRRMYLRAVKDLDSLRLRTQESAKKMARSVDLIAYTRSRVDSARRYTIEIEAEWRNAMLEVEADLRMQRQGMGDEDEFRSSASVDEVTPSTIDRIMESAKFWAHRLRVTTTAAYLITYRNLPSHLQEKLDSAIVYSTSLYELFSKSPQVNELKTSVIDNAREAIRHISENMEYTFEYLKESRVVSMLYHKESSETIEMQSLNTVHTDNESMQNDNGLSSNVGNQRPLIPLIQFSPSTIRQDCQDAMLEDSVQGTDSGSPLHSGHIPLVSDDELE